MQRPVPLVAAKLAPLTETSRDGFIDVGFAGDVYARNDFLAEFSVAMDRALGQAVWAPFRCSALVVANLEGAITAHDRPAKQKPYILRMSADVLGLFDDRFVLSLANNHIMDFGPTGLLDTMAALDDAGIAYAGAGPTLERACEPRLVQVEGVTIAIICAADPRFSPATATSPGTCPARADLLVGGIRAIAQSAQVTVVSLHMGLEHVSVPSAAQIQLAEACLAAGAQVVHFHHSHRSSGAATDGRGVVLFGTGNYVFAKRPKVWVPSSRRTAAWRVRIDKGTCRVVGVGATPVVLDGAGLPRPLGEAEAARELERLGDCSRRMLGGLPRQWTRLRDLLSPGFLRTNLYNYGYLLRRRGPQYVINSLLGGLRAQFGRHRP